MMPTQRSVIARLRYRSLDGGWSEVSLCRATKMRRFPKNAAMDRKIFTDAKRKISSACTPLISSAEQDSSTTVFWISSSVKFVSAIFLWGAMTRELKRGVLKKFLSGRLHPEVQPVTLLYTIFMKMVTLSYTFYWQMVPLSHILFITLHRLLTVVKARSFK